MKEFYVSLQDHIDMWTDYEEIIWSPYATPLRGRRHLIDLDNKLADNYFKWMDK